MKVLVAFIIAALIATLQPCAAKLFALPGKNRTSNDLILLESNQALQTIQSIASQNQGRFSLNRMTESLYESAVAILTFGQESSIPISAEMYGTFAISAAYSTIGNLRRAFQAHNGYLVNSQGLRLVRPSQVQQVIQQALQSLGGSAENMGDIVDQVQHQRFFIPTAWIQGIFSSSARRCHFLSPSQMSQIERSLIREAQVEERDRDSASDFGKHMSSLLLDGSRFLFDGMVSQTDSTKRRFFDLMQSTAEARNHREAEYRRSIMSNLFEHFDAAAADDSDMEVDSSDVRDDHGSASQDHHRSASQDDQDDLCSASQDSQDDHGSASGSASQENPSASQADVDSDMEVDSSHNDLGEEYNHCRKTMEKMSQEVEEEEEDSDLLAEEQKTHPCAKCGDPIPGDAGYCHCGGARAMPEGGYQGWQGTPIATQVQEQNNGWKCVECSAHNSKSTMKCQCCGSTNAIQAPTNSIASQPMPPSTPGTSITFQAPPPTNTDSIASQPTRGTSITFQAPPPTNTDSIASQPTRGTSITFQAPPTNADSIASQPTRGTSITFQAPPTNADSIVSQPTRGTSITFQAPPMNTYSIASQVPPTSATAWTRPGPAEFSFTVEPFDFSQFVEQFSDQNAASDDEENTKPAASEEEETTETTNSTGTTTMVELPETSNNVPAVAGLAPWAPLTPEMVEWLSLGDPIMVNGEEGVFQGLSRRGIRIRFANGTSIYIEHYTNVQVRQWME